MYSGSNPGNKDMKGLLKVSRAGWGAQVVMHSAIFLANVKIVSLISSSSSNLPQLSDIAKVAEVILVSFGNPCSLVRTPETKI